MEYICSLEYDQSICGMSLGLTWQPLLLCLILEIYWLRLEGGKPHDQNTSMAADSTLFAHFRPFNDTTAIISI